VGSALAKKLSGYVSKLTLVSAEREKLQDLKRAILQVNSLEVTTAATLHAATNIDILIHLEGACDRMEELKTGAIILTLCPKLKLPPQRKDLTLIRTGLIKLPDAQSFKLQPGLPRGIVTASLAETMLLALEEKFTSYSLTDNINPDKLEEIADIAARRGFEVWVPQAPVL
jgi:predicted amino acid dehydrogenase